MSKVDYVEVSRMSYPLSREGTHAHAYGTAVKEAENAAAGGDAERKAFWRAVAASLKIREAT